MKQCQRQIGPIYKQFIQPSHHAEIVADLLEPSLPPSREIQSNTSMFYNEPLTPDTAMSNRSDCPTLDLARLRAQYNLVRKRKRYRYGNVSDDDIHGDGEEVELDPALFIQKQKNQSASPRQFRDIRQRKKVKFAGQRKEQEFYQYMPTYSVVGAALSKQAKDPHLPRSRPYVPDGEEDPNFIYSDDSEDLMDSVRSVIHETRILSTDPIEVDEGYEDSESEKSDASDASDLSLEGMEGVSASKIQSIQGVDPQKDKLDELGEPGPTIESDVGNLRIEDVLSKPNTQWIAECPACGKSVGQNRLTDHLDTGCEGYFKTSDSHEDLVHEYSNPQAFHQTVACPMCQKFAILEKINEHLDSQCRRFLVEDILPKSSFGESSRSLKSAAKSPKPILKESGKDFQRTLGTSDTKSKGPHISFADEQKVKLLSPRPRAFLPRWMHEDPPLKPLTKIVEPQDDETARNTEQNKQSSGSGFKGNIVPIGHSVNTEEQERINTSSSSRKGKEVLYPSLPDNEADADANNEMERGRSKLRGGHVNRKRSRVRSRSHGKSRTARSLTDDC